MLANLDNEVYFKKGFTDVQAITEQQHSSEDYSVEKTVYTIVVMTAPYKINVKTKEIYRDEVLISSLNPKNLAGIERKIFNHELI